MTEKCINWLNNNRKLSPVMVFDLEKLKTNYLLFKKNYSGIKPYYAVKANPNDKILTLLNKLGSYFDCASINEIKICLKNSINPKKISYGNTIKKGIDIKEASNLGVNLFAFDAREELEKLAEYAPGSKVFCRIQVPNGGSQWPLSNKFGVAPDEVEKIYIFAGEIDLHPIGVSFHVGSQQLNKSTWEKSIKITSQIYKNLEKKGIMLKFLNIGGGFPSEYNDYLPDIISHSNFIKKVLTKYYGDRKPENIICEPGRFLVANAGIIESEVILISEAKNNNKKKWVYVDVGRYNGLAETEGEAIHYKITAKNYGKCKKLNYNLAGPSCDSHDIIYKKNPCFLPKELKIGDKLRIHSAGAYTTTYSSSFNGVRQIKEYYIE